MNDRHLLVYSLALGLTATLLTLATGTDPFSPVVQFFAKHGAIEALSRLGLLL